MSDYETKHDGMRILWWARHDGGGYMVGYESKPGGWHGTFHFDDCGRELR